MINAFTAAGLSKLPYVESTPENEFEHDKQYTFAVIRYEAVKGNTNAILYYQENLFSILRTEGFKIEKHPKLENRMVISWDHVLAS